MIQQFYDEAKYQNTMNKAYSKEILPMKTRVQTSISLLEEDLIILEFIKQHEPHETIIGIFRTGLKTTKDQIEYALAKKKGD